MSFWNSATLAAASLATVLACPPGTRTQQPAQSAPRRVDSWPFREHAVIGDAEAQFALANQYFNARYMTLDYAPALALYRQLADQGFAPAQNQLGVIYEHGFGLLINYQRAAAYYARRQTRVTRRRNSILP